jgi:prolyl-tRNA synthetase
MRQSKYFLKTSKTAAGEEPTVNGRLLEQAGYVDKLMAGVYTYLPLGLRVLHKLSQIVREEMDAVGGRELLMPMLHPKEIWQTTGGWDNIDVLFKIQSRTEREYALGQSEEEVVTPLVLARVQSYRDLPVAVYQIHWKFRDELRAKSGLLRGREFLMKDMYSFHTSQEDFDRFYAEAKEAYFRVYNRAGLVAKATEASGGNFTQKISYEFMVLTDAGEDDILYCTVCDFCVNTEIAKVVVGDVCPRSCGGVLEQARASEVGNVFDLGQKYGKDFGLAYTDEAGAKQYPIMGCYGIGVSRLMGVIAEKCNDEKGLVWPESVAPFKVHLLALPGKEPEQVFAAADKLHEDLIAAGVEVLYDDRADVSAGEKFADSDLIGIPYRVVVSAKTLAEQKVELKKRTEATAELVSLDQIRQML